MSINNLPHASWLRYSARAGIQVTRRDLNYVRAHHTIMRAHAVVLTLIAFTQVQEASASKCFFPANVRFEAGGAKVSLEQVPVIRRPIETTNNTILGVLIVGHTDRSEVSRDRAKALSLQRATAVSKTILRIYPELEGRVHVEGKGSTQPVSADPALNRRVEMEVMCIVPPGTGLPPPK